MFIYKYTHIHAVDMLKDRRVKVSAAHKLNDPFELSPTVDPKFYTIDRAIQFLRQDFNINEWYLKERTERGFTNKKNYKRWYLKTVRARAEKLMPNVGKNIEEARRVFAETFSEHWRLFCASKRKDSILMWSHYAKEHTGVVVEFDTGKQRFSEAGADYILEVEYASAKADFSYSPGYASFLRALIRVVKRKSLEWAYEEEVRVLIPITACIDTNYFSFHPSAVVKVIFGCRCPAEIRSSIRSVLDQPDYAHVLLEEASLSRDDFKLEFREVSRR